MDILTLLVICAVAFINIDGSNSVQEGINVKWSEFCYTASIWYKKDTKYKYACCGAVISDNHVLTAGHCVYDRAPKDFYIITGTSNIEGIDLSEEPPAQSTWCCFTFTGSCMTINKIAQITVHPRYVQIPTFSGKNYYSLNDMAIIKVTCPIPMNCCSKKINLPSQNIEEKLCKVAGWGAGDLDIPQRHEPHEPHSILAYAIYQPKVSGAYADLGRDNEFLATQVEGYVMPGDSGCPLVCDNVVVGVLMKGFRGIPATFAYTYVELQFIRSAIGT